jgi:hypothetical protein
MRERPQITRIPNLHQTPPLERRNYSGIMESKGKFFPATRLWSRAYQLSMGPAGTMGLQT